MFEKYAFKKRKETKFMGVLNTPQNNISKFLPLYHPTKTHKDYIQIIKCELAIPSFNGTALLPANFNNGFMPSH